MVYDLVGRSLFPLRDLFERSDFPLADLLPPGALDGVFAGLYFTEAESYSSGDNHVLTIRLAFAIELALRVPGIDAVEAVVASGGEGWTSVMAEFVLGSDPSITLREVP